MSKYTTEVRWIVEQMTYGSKKNIRERIVDSCPLIFDFDFPIYDESHRIVLETKILAHYFNYEIGLETVGLWKLYLWEKLNNIMPGYNMVYKKLASDFSIFDNLDLWENIQGSNEMDETGNQTSESEGKGSDTQIMNSSGEETSNSSSTNKVLKSDLPQVNYANVDYGTTLDDGQGTQTNHINTSNDSTTTNTNSTESNGSISNKLKRNNIDSRIRHLAGKQGNENFAELFKKYGDNILNVDNMIIRDLKDLFMMIY